MNFSAAVTVFWELVGIEANREVERCRNCVPRGALRNCWWCQAVTSFCAVKVNKGFFSTMFSSSEQIILGYWFYSLLRTHIGCIAWSNGFLLIVCPLRNVVAPSTTRLNTSQRLILVYEVNSNMFLRICDDFSRSLSNPRIRAIPCDRLHVGVWNSTCLVDIICCTLQRRTVLCTRNLGWEHASKHLDFALNYGVTSSTSFKI